MLCKLIKFHSTDLSGYANETFEDIIIHICDGISDWEEIDEKEYYRIKQWIYYYNLEHRKNNEWYLLVEKPPITLKFCLKEQIEYEKRKMEKEKKREEEYKKQRELEKLNRLKKKAEREKKKLEELKKKYGEQ